MDSLFSEEELNKTNPKPEKRDNSWEQEQFCRLGEMMGDGLHHEPDGKWIPKEYKRLMYILHPEIKEDLKKAKAKRKERRMEQMQVFFKTNFCTVLNCKGTLYQRNPGTLICYCSKCQMRYSVRTKKRK